jgi:hypothetical protein
VLYVSKTNIAFATYSIKKTLEPKRLKEKNRIRHNWVYRFSSTRTILLHNFVFLSLCYARRIGVVLMRNLSFLITLCGKCNSYGKARFLCVIFNSDKRCKTISTLTTTYRKNTDSTAANIPAFYCYSFPLFVANQNTAILPKTNFKNRPKITSKFIIKRGKLTAVFSSFFSLALFLVFSRCRRPLLMEEIPTKFSLILNVLFAMFCFCQHLVSERRRVKRRL